ncbi:MAG: hypothetical protein ACYDHU_03975 [Acidimicrobiales bacterium]
MTTDPRRHLCRGGPLSASQRRFRAASRYTAAPVHRTGGMGSSRPSIAHIPPAATIARATAR